MGSTYQVMLPLSQADYEAMKKDIADRGVQVPVEYDQDGNIIDGHHRVRACAELGIKEWPRIDRTYVDDAAKRTQARKLNLLRRQMSQAEKQEQVEAELRERPEMSNRLIANDLGVNKGTVMAARERLELGGQIGHPEKRIGRDGLKQAATKTKGKDDNKRPARKGKKSSRNRGRPKGTADNRRSMAGAAPETEHDRDLRTLHNVWIMVCQTAKHQFLQEITEVEVAQ